MHHCKVRAKCTGAKLSLKRQKLLPRSTMPRGTSPRCYRFLYCAICQFVQLGFPIIRSRQTQPQYHGKCWDIDINRPMLHGGSFHQAPSQPLWWDVVACVAKAQPQEHPLWEHIHSEQTSFWICSLNVWYHSPSLHLESCWLLTPPMHSYAFQSKFFVSQEAARVAYFIPSNFPKIGSSGSTGPPSVAKRRAALDTRCHDALNHTGNRCRPES